MQDIQTGNTGPLRYCSSVEEDSVCERSHDGFTRTFLLLYGIVEPQRIFSLQLLRVSLVSHDARCHGTCSNSSILPTATDPVATVLSSNYAAIHLLFAMITTLYYCKSHVLSAPDASVKDMPPLPNTRPQPSQPRHRKQTH